MRYAAAITLALCLGGARAAAQSAPRDSPPEGAQVPAPKGVSKIEYEGWRQYSVNCARCHGQDVLPNPVAANLLNRSTRFTPT
jgi:mono/diheme cytochrome c family protein